MAMMNGRMYSEVPFSVGTQSMSVRTNSTMACKASSGSICGMQRRRLVLFIRSMFLFGRKSSVRLSAARYALSPSNISCA